MTKYFDFDNKENYGVQVCTSTTRPTAYDGRSIYETDTNKFLIYNGASWEEISGGTTVHSSLSNLAWSVAGHTIDAAIDMNDNNITEVGGILPKTDGANNFGSSSLLWNLVYTERVLGSSTNSLVCDFRGDAAHKIWFNGITANDLEYNTFAEHRFKVNSVDILKIDGDEIALATGKKSTFNGVGGGTYIKDDASGNMELHVATGKKIKIVVG